MNIVGGQPQIQDQDNLVCEIAWKPLEELKALALNYPEDRDYLVSHFTTVMTTK